MLTFPVGHGGGTVILYVFLYFLNFWLGWVFLAPHGLFSSFREWGQLSSCSAQDVSLQWLLFLPSMGSLQHVGFGSCGSWGLEHRLRICGTRDYLLRGMWDLPGPGAEPVSPALVAGFCASEPPGMSHIDS